jgi:hypothetical protein
VVAAMASSEHVVEPNPEARAFHEAKRRVFLHMYEDQLAYRTEMARF